MTTDPRDPEPAETAPMHVEGLPGQESRNRYAVPLSTLLAGAVVPLADQVEIQPDSPVEASQAWVPPLLGDADGGE